MQYRRSANPLWRLYEIMVMGTGLGLLALICLGSIPLFIVLFVLLPRRWHRSVSRQIISLGLRGYLWVLHWLCQIRTDLKALAPLRQERSLILIANHPSLLDAVMLLACFPNGTCVMKASLLNNPLYGVAARMAGYVSNAEPKKMIEDSCVELQQGAHFIIFPEGGRSREFPVSRFSSASLLLSRMSKTPLQSIVFEFSTPYLGKNWGLFTPPVLPLTIRARLGQRMEPAQAAEPGALAELEAYFRRELSQRATE